MLKAGANYEFSFLGSSYVLRWLPLEGEGKGLHARAWVHEDDDRYATVLRLEWHLPTRHFGARAHFTRDDMPITASLQALLFGLYVSADHPRLRRLRNWVLAVFPGDMRADWSGRNFGIGVHDWALWWDVGSDDYGWTCTRPRWKDGSWRPFGFLRRQGEPEILEEREVLIPLPERSYRATARLERTHWGFDKLPRFFDREDRHVDLKMADGEQIPVPGKGENSWDCGEDATFGMYGPARTIEDAIGKLVASVLRTRHRRGGSRWMPEPKAA